MWKSNKKILVAIPAFNEESVILQTISDLKKNDIKDILVINDGSFDHTKELLQKTPGIILINHFKNRGLGLAIRTAFKFAKKNNYDILVTFDADGQHLASDIKKVIEPVLNDQADVVLGIRDFGRLQVSLMRKIILVFSNIYTWFLFGIYSRDSQSGFRAFSRCALETMSLHGDRMEISSEIVSEIKKKHLKMAEIPICVVYTKYSLAKGQKNSNLFNVGFQLLLKMLK